MGRGEREQQHRFVRARSVALAAGIALAGCGVQDEEEPLSESERNHAGHAEHGDAGAQGGAASAAGKLTIEATDPMAWTYVDLTAGAVVSIADPASSDSWDLGFRRAQLATNSGTSHAADAPTLAGALDTGATDWDALDACPTDGYQVDAMLPVAGPPGSGEYSGNPAFAEWFDYDAATHAVSSKQHAYCVRTAEGDYAKFMVVSYAGGTWSVRFQLL